MKIIIKMSNNTNDNAEQRIRATLAHITHLIWIKSIEKANTNDHVDFFNKQEIYVIQCNPQGSTEEDQSLAMTVAQALRMNGNIQLLNISITNTKQFEAIKKISDTAYEADPFYSSYLARNDEYRKDVQTKCVLKASFEVEQVGEDSFRPTGKISTQFDTKVAAGFNPKNIYNSYAAALSLSDDLRETMINSDVAEILLALNENQKLLVAVTARQKFGFDFSKAATPATRDDQLTTDISKLNLEDKSSPEAPKFRK